MATDNEMRASAAEENLLNAIHQAGRGGGKTAEMCLNAVESARTGAIVLLARPSEREDVVVMPAARYNALREVAEQAAILYNQQYADAIADGDAQGENFWEGHRDAALDALGRLSTHDGTVTGSAGHDK